MQIISYWIYLFSQPHCLQIVCWCWGIFRSCDLWHSWGIGGGGEEAAAGQTGRRRGKCKRGEVHFREFVLRGDCIMSSVSKNKEKSETCRGQRGSRQRLALFFQADEMVSNLGSFFIWFCTGRQVFVPAQVVCQRLPKWFMTVPTQTDSDRLIWLIWGSVKVQKHYSFTISSTSNGKLKDKPGYGTNKKKMGGQHTVKSLYLRKRSFGNHGNRHQHVSVIATQKNKLQIN